MTEAPVVFFTGSSVIWGAELSMLSIAEHMTHDVELVTSNPALAAQWQRQVRMPVTLVRASSGRVSRLVGFFSTAARVALRGETIVVFDFYLLPIFVALRPVIKLRRARVAVDIHDSARTSWRRRCYFWLTRFTDVAICISNFVTFNVRSGRICVVRRPVDAVDSHVSSRSLPVLGTVGQIASDKKIMESMRAAHAADEQTVFLLRGASTPENEEYHREVRELGVRLFGSNFRDEGRVPRRATMAGIDVLVLANEEEPFGRVAVEAQLAGTLVVGPNAGGIGEVIQDGINGFCFEPHSTPSQIAEKIRQALQVWRAGDAFTEAAKQSAKSAYSPKSRALEYTQALSE